MKINRIDWSYSGYRSECFDLCDQIAERIESTISSNNYESADEAQQDVYSVQDEAIKAVCGDTNSDYATVSAAINESVSFVVVLESEV